MSNVHSIDINAAIQAIRSKLPEELHRPVFGIICGSGLSGLGDSLKDKVIVPYSEIPGFGQSSVAGHKSSLAFGTLGNGTPVVAMLGRFHPYEGHPLPSVVFPVRTLVHLGVENLIITNAAGALNPKFPVGTVIVVQDHLALPDLAGMNPLLGPQISPDLPRFVPLSDAYSPSLRRLAFLAAHELQLDDSALQEGVYAWVSGPTYETPAEGRFLRAAGADVVGMSTVPEVLAAKEEGIKHLMVLSLVTNPVIIPEGYRSIKEEVAAELAGKRVELPVDETVSHEEVLEIGRQKGEMMKNLVSKIVELLPKLV